MDAGDKARHRCRAAKTPRPIGNKEGVEAIMEVVNERLAAAHTRHSVSMYDVRYEEPSVAPNFAGAEAGGAEEGGGQTSDCDQAAQGANARSARVSTTPQRSLAALDCSSPVLQRRTGEPFERSGFRQLCSAELASAMPSTPSSPLLAMLQSARVHESSGWHFGRLTDESRPKSRPSLLPPAILLPSPIADAEASA